MNQEELKVEAYRQELSSKTEQVIDLRVQLTVLDEKLKQALSEIEELKRIAPLEEGSTEAPDAGTENSNDSD